MLDPTLTPTRDTLRREQLADDLTDLAIIRKHLKAALGAAMVNALKMAGDCQVVDRGALINELGDFESIAEDAIDGLFKAEERRVM